jgi:hypothetical protein
LPVLCPAGHSKEKPSEEQGKPVGIKLSITVKKAATIYMHWPKPPPPPPPENEEVVALRWLQKMGRYSALESELEQEWWMKFVNCQKKPCGRVEKQGSQQHEIEMVFPSKSIAERLSGVGLPGVRMHLKQRYFVDPEARIASWRDSKSTDTYVIEDAYHLGDYLSLHERNLSKKLMLYKSSKLAPITKLQDTMHAPFK